MTRVAVVTGGARGIGEAACVAFLEQGLRVVVADTDAEAARATAARLDSSGENAVALSLDVASTQSVERMVDAVHERFGALDVLVNNAGIMSPRASHEVSDDDWANLLDVHLGGTFRCSRSALPLLAASGAGAIVNVASVAAHVGIPRRASYSAAKAAIEGLTRTLAVEWAPHGIRVNGVAPGWTRTPLVRQAIERGIVDDRVLASHVPLGRLAEATEVAQVIAFLASPAAAYVTGQTLVVDGGMTINGDFSLPRAAAPPASS